MESVCVLKTMSTFAHNTTEIPSKHGKPFSAVFSLPDSIRKEQSLKRSMECGNDIDEQVSPVKQKRSDEPRDQIVLDHVHAISSKEQFFTPHNMVSAESSVKSCNEICPELPSDNNCQTGSVTDDVCDRHTCSRSSVTGRQKVTAGSAQKHDSSVNAESIAALRKDESPNSPVANRDVVAPTQNTSDLRDGDVAKSPQEETFSQSFPCNATSESERDRISPPHTASFTSSSRPDHSEDEKRDLSSFVQQNMTQSADDNNDNHDSDNNDNNNIDDNEIMDNNCDSLPPTPSSGFIDIEADTPPSSPLNLTTNSNSDNQTRCHTGENQNEDSQRREASPKPPHTFLSERLLGHSSITHKVSHETKTDFQNSEKSPTDKQQEKKTNFSIDAILRPDFGALNNSSPSQVSFQQPKTHNQNSHFKNSFKSSHSAFTAVDLSTRSRSDSLSSPSSSNSSSSLSPSPPLSNSSLSPGHKHSLTPGMVYDKYHPGQENFLFASRLFPDPTKDFESFIGGNFPLLGSVHGNSIAKFPFLYGPQPSQQYKLSHNNTHPQDSDISKTKPDHLQTNISKLLTCSLYPFLNNPQSRNFPESPKLSRETGDNLKLRNDPALQALRHNHNSKLGHDLSAISRSSEKSQPQNVVSPTRKASSGQGNASTTVKTNADTGKPVVKNEDSGSTEGKTQERGGKGKDGNPLWPAWVFCTRYSDRPSSGPRSRKPKRNKSQDEKRPRTAFTNDQLQRLKREFEDCRYLTETRRKNLADELGLTESQIKIWFQNKRAKIKKSVGVKNPLALQLMEQGLYNHSTVKLGDESS